MYKCIDERGKSTYADKPGPGCKQVDIRGSPYVSGNVQPAQGSAGQDEAGFRRRQIERERADEREKAALLERCSALRGELGRLSGGRRIVQKITASGERVYLDDQARDQRVAQLNDDLRGCP